MKVIIGTPVHRPGAYALEAFLSNQREIQQRRPDCELVFCTDDTGFVAELENMMRQRSLRGVVIPHKVEKPGYAKSRLWSIASGREAARRYFISRPDAEGLLFLDADMTFDPDVVDIMEREIAGCDAVFSGYWHRLVHLGLAGAGCLLLRRKAAEKIKFRCYEFKNGEFINEDYLAEMDLFRRGCRIKKGFFLTIDHYASWGEIKRITPRRVGLLKKLSSSSLVRYCLIRLSVALHYNLTSKGVNVLRQLRYMSRKPRGAGEGSRAV